MTDTTKQAEPFAWATFDGEGGYDLRLYENNESYRIDYYTQNGPKYEGWVKPLYTHPAPALTAELRAELIECLKMGLTAQMYVHGTERKSPNFIKEVYCERQDKIQAAITKLTNLGEAK